MMCDLICLYAHSIPNGRSAPIFKRRTFYESILDPVGAFESSIVSMFVEILFNSRERQKNAKVSLFFSIFLLL